MRKLSKEQILEKLNLSSIKTGYVYSYTGNERQSDKIKVFCPLHNHTDMQSREYATQSRKIACCNKFAPMLESDFNRIIEQFTDKSNIEIIGNFCGYDTIVKVKCDIHGERNIKLTSLMAKKTEFACNKCSHKKYNRNFAYSKDRWISECIKVHGNLYSYDKLENDGLHRTITCKNHGDFLQNIHNHVYLKNGCPKCVITPNVSAAEHELCDFFKSLMFVEGSDFTRNDRSILPRQELDFYFKNLNLAIEYNGDYWHSFGRKEKDYHINKKISGINTNINIIMVYEHQYKTKKQIILNRLRSVLGKDSKLYAKHTEIKEIDNKSMVEFCNAYHLQGSTVSSIRYGLFNGNNLVAVMTFGKSRFTSDHEYELLRYVSNGTVVGGASKLFAYFLQQVSPSSILSYADFDWSTGNMYEKLGFKKIGSTAPSYVWVKGTEVLSRYQTQIADEDSIMTNNGYLKIYKCGSLKYEWRKVIDK